MATKHWVALDSPCEVGASAPSSSELGAGAPARPWVARAPRAEGGAAHRPVLPGARRRSRNLIEPLLERGANPSLCAAIHRVGERMEEVSWGRLIDRVRAASEGLVELGIEPGDRVCIFAPTRVDWCVADLAIMGVGAVTAPIYASNTPEEIEHVLRDSGARAIFIDGEVGEGGASGRWSRIRAAMAQVPALERVIAFDLPSDPASRLLSLADLEERGRKRLADHPRGLEERSRALGPDDLACICYTTGTTGVSKGVMLTHGTWTYQAQAVTQVGLMAQADIVLLFLPLAHSFGKVVQAAWLDQGFPLAFARSPETAVDDAAAVGATVMPAVPRLFEKAFAKVVGEAGAQPGIKGRLFRWAMEQFDQYAVARLEGREFDSLQWRLARRVVFAKIQKRLQARFGGRMRAFISGSAPLSRRIALFFEECGLAILEGYGLTETAAPTHVNRPDFIRLGTVGLPFPEVETRIADDGEVLLRGPQVMKGYYGKPELTAEVLDADGWLHTGDIGEIDPEGCLRITDRKKDLIKTSGGKYLAPQQLEQMLAAIPLVSHVVVIGDRRRFVSALFTISAEEGGRWAAGAGLGLVSYEALVRDPVLRARIQAALDEINARLPSYATIKKFAILEREFSIENGELTAKLSVRRKVVAERYKAIVDELYGDAVID